MGINLSDLNTRQQDMIDPADRKRLGIRSSEQVEAKRQAQAELELHTQFWSFLRRNGFRDIQYSNPHKRTTVKAGTPDFLITRDSRRLAIEFKVESNKLSPAQVEWFQMANEERNAASCVYSYEEAVRQTIVFFNL